MLLPNNNTEEEKKNRFSATVDRCDRIALIYISHIAVSCGLANWPSGMNEEKRGDHHVLNIPHKNGGDWSE